MATSRYRRRKTPRQQVLRKAHPEFVDLDSVEIITPDSLKEGAVAELTPPEAQQVLPPTIQAHVYVAPKPESELSREITEAASPLSPSAGRLTAIPVAMPVGSSSVSESISESYSEEVEYSDSQEDDWPEIDSYDDGEVVADLSEDESERATVAISREMPQPVLPVFAPREEEVEEAVEELVENEIVEAPVLERSQTRTTHDLRPVADEVETELEPETTSTTKVAHTGSRRSVLFVPLMFALGICIGLLAGKWAELETYYLAQYQAWQASQNVTAPMPGDEAPTIE